ncbi:MAG: glycosyltransferase [Alphaproteobacteria bacterium]|nr:MAG: glycosyltransferase [Alphaproteobacteria bacterium]
MDIDYRVVYSDPPLANKRKRDTVEIPWSLKVPVRRVLSGRLTYQCALQQALSADLVIVQQENKLLLNYVLHIVRRFGGVRLAYFGHGRNFQARDRNSREERWKRFWTTRVDWWFGYTEETRAHLIQLGFPPERVTVFNNAVDTRLTRTVAESTPEKRLDDLRREMGLTGSNVGIFVGGLYPDKRLGFLIDAAERVRAQLSDFELLVVGGGEELQRVEGLASLRPWMRVTGPRFGTDKVELMRLAKLFLMPGLVGLAVLDAGAAGLPTITTAFPWHSPEIAYLEPEVNGLIIEQWQDPQAYADAVIALLCDPGRLSVMSHAARVTAETRSVEAMAENFAAGVVAALRSKPGSLFARSSSC